jgi:tRNA threonylcarbamoyladenosine biosynthesis protein TsaE
MPLKGISVTYLSSSNYETLHLGKILGSLLSKGDMVALVGDLGSGKTWFTKGLAIGLGVDPKIVITSPSFALVNEYEGRFTFYHMDLYRLADLSDVVMSGLYEYLFEEAVVIMEWADRWPDILPEHRVKVEISIIDEFQREINLSGCQFRSVKIVENFNQEVIKA